MGNAHAENNKGSDSHSLMDLTAVAERLLPPAVHPFPVGNDAELMQSPRSVPCAGSLHSQLTLSALQ